MGHRLITQLILIGTALAIVFVYVQPTFSTVRQTQTELQQYATTIAKATQYNQTLAALIQKDKSFSQSDLAAVNAFLPTSIDDLSVMADISTIATNAGVSVSKLTTGSSQNQNQGQSDATNNNQQSGMGSGRTVSTSTTPTLTHHDYTVTISGSYDAFKQFLLALAQNKYQIDVTSLTFGGSSSDQSGQSTAANTQSSSGSSPTDYSMTLRVYGLSQ